MGDAPPPQPVFMKKRNRSNIRKKSLDIPEDSPTSAPSTSAPSTSAPPPRKRPAAGLAVPSANPTSSAPPNTGGAIHTFSATGRIQQRGDGGATRHLETETSTDRDGRALREKQLAAAASGQPAAGDDQIYRGQASYTDYRAGFRREGHTAGAEKGSGAHGPLRATTAIRASVRMDYAPDVCKDYKETGYCGWGDACKFLHTREDYKSGWEVEAEWQAQQKAQDEAIKRKMERALTGKGEGSSSDEGEEGSGDEGDGLPFACLTCRLPWTQLSDPIVTPCKHYFCENCALKNHSKKKVCAQCGEPTHGLFNTAREIIAKTKKMREEEAAEKATVALEKGEGDVSEEGGREGR